MIEALDAARNVLLAGFGICALALFLTPLRP